MHFHVPLGATRSQIYLFPLGASLPPWNHGRGLGPASRLTHQSCTRCRRSTHNGECPSRLEPMFARPLIVRPLPGVRFSTPVGDKLRFRLTSARLVFCRRRARSLGDTSSIFCRCYRGRLESGHNRPIGRTCFRCSEERIPWGPLPISTGGSTLQTIASGNEGCKTRPHVAGLHRTNFRLPYRAGYQHAFGKCSKTRGYLKSIGLSTF